jgi:hypothetical protein
VTVSYDPKSNLFTTSRLRSWRSDSQGPQLQLGSDRDKLDDLGIHSLSVDDLSGPAGPARGDRGEVTCRASLEWAMMWCTTHDLLAGERWRHALRQI